MTDDQLIRDLSEGWSEISRYQAVDRLREHLDDLTVLMAVCSAALKERNTSLREHIVDALRPVRREASRLFEKAAAKCPSATIRRRAFVNLSLLECRTARSTVIQGLDDPDPAVRIAASLSMGLYNDLTFVSVVEGFLEKNRFGLLKKSMDEFFASLLLRQNRQNRGNCGVVRTNLQGAI